MSVPSSLHRARPRPHPRPLRVPAAAALAGALCAAAATLPAHADTTQVELGVTVSRVGSASAPSVAGATPLYLDQYALQVTFDTASASGSLPSLSATRTGSTLTPLRVDGSDSSQGVLSLSADRRRLLLGGQDATAGAPTLDNWLAPPAAAGQLVDASAPVSVVGASALRGSASSGAGSYYSAVQAAGGGGIVRGSFSDPGAAPLLLNGAGMNTDVRQLRIGAVYGGGNVSSALFYSAGSAGGTAGVYQLGTAGLPTDAGAASSLLAATRYGATPNGFFFADLSRDQAGIDTLYIGTDNDGIEKFSLVTDAAGQTSWVFNGAAGTPLVYKQGLGRVSDSRAVIGMDGLGEPGVTITPDGGQPTTLPALALGLATVQHHVVVRNSAGAVVSDTTSSELDAFVDLSGYNQAPVGQFVLQTLAGGDALANEQLLGVALNTPLPAVPEPSSSALLLAGLGLTGLWRLRRLR